MGAEPFLRGIHFIKKILTDLNSLTSPLQCVAVVLLTLAVLYRWVRAISWIICMNRKWGLSQGMWHGVSARWQLYSCYFSWSYIRHHVTKIISWLITRYIWLTVPKHYLSTVYNRHIRLGICLDCTVTTNGQNARLWMPLLPLCFLDFLPMACRMACLLTFTDLHNAIIPSFLSYGLPTL